MSNLALDAGEGVIVKAWPLPVATRYWLLNSFCQEERVEPDHLLGRWPCDVRRAGWHFGEFMPSLPPCF
jgi:hypothetical protein